MANAVKSFRETRINLPSQTATLFSKGNTRPNYFIFVNNSASTVFVGVSPNVSATNFEAIIPPLGSRTYGRPDPPEELWFYSTGPAWIYVGSMEREFDPTMITQTQEIAATGASGLLGSVDVRNILNALPIGVNHIGSVAVDSLPVLPAGGNLIGRVIIDEIPAGINHIGNVGISSVQNGEVLKPAAGLSISIVDIQVANTEYAFTVPTGSKKVTMSERGGADFRWCLEAGKIATKTEPYVDVSGESIIDDILFPAGTMIFLAADSTAIIQIICQI